MILRLSHAASPYYTKLKVSFQYVSALCSSIHLSNLEVFTLK
uniref:Uncharacterized protein n=1 Tax=Anguilla anguilla TaxID=7936 RepID=A0A0E9SF73_ANGAN